MPQLWRDSLLNTKMSDNSSDEEVLVLTLALAAAEEEEQEEKQWMHPICASREQEGEYFTLFPHLCTPLSHHT